MRLSSGVCLGDFCRGKTIFEDISEDSTSSSTKHIVDFLLRGALEQTGIFSNLYR